MCWKATVSNILYVLKVTYIRVLFEICKFCYFTSPFVYVSPDNSGSTVTGYDLSDREVGRIDPPTLEFKMRDCSSSFMRRLGSAYAFTV
jgi:hypothetical protein